jgi:hypothetical protein
MIYTAPEITAVIRTAGATFAAPRSSADDGANCPDKASAVDGPVAPAPSPKLVWVPTAGSTP